MATSITWDDVVNIAPETANVPPDAQFELLGVVGRQINATAWGVKAEDGAKYLAAHLATLYLRRGSGVIASETVGALSVTYANIVQNHGLLATTPYGAQCLLMIRQLPIARFGLVV